MRLLPSQPRATGRFPDGSDVRQLPIDSLAGSRSEPGSCVASLIRGAMTACPTSNRSAPMFLLALIAVIRIIRKNRAQNQNVNERPMWKELTVGLGSLSLQNLKARLAIAVVMLGSGLQVSTADDGMSVHSSASQARKYASRTNEELLREGTMIPPTVGTIIQVGRRWVFAPSNPETLTPRFFESGGTMRHLSSGMIAQARPTRLGTATDESATGSAGQVAETQSTREKPLPPKQSGAVPSNQTREVANEGKLIVLSENLMLQRIVEAVVADAADNRWTISGEITEFRNQNRLRIHTAQRTNQR